MILTVRPLKDPHVIWAGARFPLQPNQRFPLRVVLMEANAVSGQSAAWSHALTGSRETTEPQSDEHDMIVQAYVCQGDVDTRRGQCMQAPWGQAQGVAKLLRLPNNQTIRAPFTLILTRSVSESTQ
jgi:hypothetical protein